MLTPFQAFKICEYLVESHMLVNYVNFCTVTERSYCTKVYFHTLTDLNFKTRFIIANYTIVYYFRNKI